MDNRGDKASVLLNYSQGYRGLMYVRALPTVPLHDVIPLSILISAASQWKTLSRDLKGRVGEGNDWGVGERKLPVVREVSIRKLWFHGFVLIGGLKQSLASTQCLGR